MSRALRLPWLCMLAGVALLLSGAWIPLKAALAQHLLDRAWASTVSSGQPQRAWAWADHWPVAKLSLPTGSGAPSAHIVLEGDQGAVLAFAPGHTPGSGLTHANRTVIISGHRDTHFRTLDQLSAGDFIKLDTPDRSQRYSVTHTDILDSRTDTIPLDRPGQLALVTCWPLGAVASGPLRYVVWARAA